MALHGNYSFKKFRFFRKTVENISNQSACDGDYKILIIESDECVREQFFINNFLTITVYRYLQHEATNHEWNRRFEENK